MQREIKQAGPLLNEQGHLIEAGYAKSLIRTYDRDAIKANHLRIKEWDYYRVNDGKRALALTIADNSYMGMYSVSWIDLAGRQETTKSVMTVLPRGSTGLPSDSSSGDVSFRNKKIALSFVHEGDSRILRCKYPDFQDGKTLEANVVLTEAPAETMVIMTPYEKDDKAFYYNQKINCIRANGTVRLGTDVYRFHDAWAVLDWGRGVWTYSNTWYWSSASGVTDGHRFGFNLGYGFGDTSAASENMLFYDGKAHKLERVTFHIPKESSGRERYLDTWRITSSDDRLRLVFEPVLDRASDTNVLLIRSDQHQVFGLFSGRAVLDDGRVIRIKNFPGFAEKVQNRW